MKTIEINLPPDKSISHRAAIFGSIFDGETTVENFSTCEDCLSTLSCLKKLGLKFSLKNHLLKIQGKGLQGLVEPTENLNCGNSGTTMRFLTGLLVGQKFDSVLVGDDSLSKRPMERVVKPLSLMNAKIELSENGTAPIRIYGSKLKPISYEMPVESAQVKSAIQLASLYAGKSKIFHKTKFRNHTDLMLEEFLTAKKKWEIKISNDFSSASFWIVFGIANRKNLKISLKEVGLNPTRTAFLEVVKKMGARIEVQNERLFGNEPVGDLLVFPSKTKNVEIPQELIPNLIDEIPILAILVIFSEGRFSLRNVSELRVKEADRILALTKIFRALELDFQEFSDGFEFEPSTSLPQVVLPETPDHRIAMSSAILSLLSEEKVEFKNLESTKISYPNFEEEFLRLKSIKWV